MVSRKFLSEFGLNMVNGLRLMLQDEHLHKISELGIKPHIYIIARRPRITLVPESIKFEGKIIKGFFKQQIKDKYKEIPFITNNYLGTDDLRINCNYPYTSYEIIDNKKNKVVSNGKSSLLLASLDEKFQKYLDLEVLYVGQSYGDEGSRTADTRLKSHSTLQEVYSAASRESPDQDIWLFVSEFNHQLLVTFDGTQDKYETTMEEDDDHIESVFKNKITEKQKINFTEAALIRYFKPEYNDKFKNTFPSNTHSSYSECYDIDLNMITVEIQTKDLLFRFWSDAVKSSYTHFCSFPLHSRKEREYMFEIAGKKVF